MSLLSELRGVFALLVWNASTRSLLATRDPLGMHPLFYAQIGRELVLSWSIDALLDAGAPRDINRVFIAEHLARRWRARQDTYFSAIRRIPAGHRLTVTNDTRVEPYWHPFRGATADREGDAWLDEFELHLEQAVARCLELGRAGIFLSGGVDSTTVTLAAARVSARRELPPPLALSVRFPDPGSDEDEEQRRVASALGLPRCTCSAQGRDAEGGGLLESSLAAIAEGPVPIGAPWDFAYQTLARKARARGCVVVLTGEGGDEWLALPRVYAADLLHQLELRRLGSFLTRTPRQERTRPVTLDTWDSAVRPLLHRALMRRFARVSPSLYSRYRQARHPLPGWLGPDKDLRDALQHLPEGPESDGFARVARESTLGHPLVSMYLEDYFTAGRIFGIPLLHPLWDVDLVRFLCATPLDMLELGGQPKGLAVELAKRRLPSLGDSWPRRVTADAFLERVLREGLPPLWRSIGGARTLGGLGIVDPARTERMIQAAGTREGLPLRDAWAIVTSEAWLRRRIGG